MPDEISNYLEKYKLFGFQQRVALRLSLFGHKIENIPNAPPKLKEQLLHCKDRNIPYSLRKTTSTTLYEIRNRLNLTWAFDWCINFHSIKIKKF
jgi:hypothetical protein